MFCEGVQHCLNCVKMAAFQFYLQSSIFNALDFTLHLPRLSRSALNQACHSNTCIWSMLSSLNACPIIARVSVTLFPRFTQNLKHTRCRIHHIASGQTHDSK
jgi:hypothetical protein